MVLVATRHAVHHEGTQTLGLRDWAIFVCQQESLEVDDFLTELSHSSGKSIILSSEKLDLGLEVGQPLLLALATLESSDTG